MNRNRSPLIVAGIPAYNEEKTMAKVILLAQKHVNRIIVCDDGSTDMTAEIAEGLGADVVRHRKSLGYGAAIQGIFKRARELGADVTITLDGDGQHDPNEIPVLIKPILKDDVDVAVGSRFLGKEGKEDVPFHRRVGIKAITKLTRVAIKSKISDAQHGFRAYNHKALESLKLFENGMGASVEVLMKAKEQGLKVTEVPMGCNYRGLEKTSRYNPLRHGISVVASIMRLVVEERPLLFLGAPGVISLFVGVLFGVWMLQLYAVEQSITTNIALASIAFILIGFFALSTAITLYPIQRLTQKNSNVNETWNNQK